MSAPRRWARRAVLSMLAGGGLSAAGFGGPLAGGALGAEVSTGTTTSEDQAPAVTETTSQAPASGQEGSSWCERRQRGEWRRRRERDHRDGCQHHLDRPRHRAVQHLDVAHRDRAGDR